MLLDAQTLKNKNNKVDFLPSCRGITLSCSSGRHNCAPGSDFLHGKPEKLDQIGKQLEKCRI